MSVKIKESDVKAGDVICRPVKAGSGKHYGICVENGDVIHFTKKGILRERFDAFASSCEVSRTE